MPGSAVAIVVVVIVVVVVGVLGTVVLRTVEVVEDGAEVDADWNEIK